MEDREETFLAKMVLGGRVTVPYEIREKLGLKQGDLVKMRVRREEPLPAPEGQDPPRGG